MDFELTEQQQELVGAVRAVLERECPTSCVRERVERDVAPREPWKSAVELGWTAMAIPERYGGLGLSYADLALVVEEHGRFCAPGPFLATVTQFAAAVREAGRDEACERFLSAVAAGEITGALAVADATGACAPPHGLRAEPDAGGWILTGARHFVVDGDAADEIAVAAHVDLGDGVGLFAVPRRAAKTRRLVSLDASRPVATAELDGVRVDAERVLGRPGADAPALARALEEATVAMALEMVGTCQAIFERTLDHARQREQFGHPIGSFQAIQHKFADMLVALEKARSTAYFAAMTLAEDDPRRALATSMAKVAAGDAQRLIAKEGIQIHGGVAFTWEHDIQLFVKRAKAGELLFGTSSEHRARVADLLGI